MAPVKEMVKKGFWSDLERIVNRVGNGYILCVLGDLNGWIGDRMRAGITITFGVPGKNDSGRIAVEFFVERGMCLGDTYFEHKGGKGARWSRGKAW